jgi:hypothetical protein
MNLHQSIMKNYWMKILCLLLDEDTLSDVITICVSNVISAYASDASHVSGFTSSGVISVCVSNAISVCVLDVMCCCLF